MNDNTHDMSVWGLISEASLLVQLVMLTLVLASVISWYLILWRTRTLSKLEKQAKYFRREFRSSDDLRLLHAKTRADQSAASLASIFLSGFGAFCQPHNNNSISNQQDHIERAMLVNIGEQEAEMEKGLSTLATIGSVSPYIGLFGTVWGIMNSFIGLAQVEQATLNTVAPGIAEALIATAIGLFAAIPAVIAYNRLSARNARITALYYQFGNELVTRLQRIGQAIRPQQAA